MQKQQTFGSFSFSNLLLYHCRLYTVDQYSRCADEDHEMWLKAGKKKLASDLEWGLSNWQSGFELLVGKKKQFEESTLGS